MTAGARPLVLGMSEGENPVGHLRGRCVRPVFFESCSLEWERKLGGTFHLKLSIHSSPIENKYREGKVQSTLERELNVPETAVVQACGACPGPRGRVCLRSAFILGGPCTRFARGACLWVIHSPSRGKRQHRFAFHELPEDAGPPGSALGWGLGVDCLARASAFS